ncbi:uncharacterized protein LOC9303602 isoform X2 [Arabidopsis lyrata subsp. lyrata]|uniref:uncharacterized protein LOC9303602 isoform X2 n=1 Tax=Arabidopsis lyrata subsp. lyrata TaxID=81972 RepID=UPI000A29DF87|nr:uncharacterized protein LOC9303602 isoform X2 [Arabidopsis lyrata subsp. lyrata]|eukprot:XP_020873457.1 uncharacterized protein LOC9303602 isoform X2 [Arabidopsis lyrata subsp. lyrata]
MGNARKVEDDDNNNSSSSSSSLLIAATMCIIGLQVHVHVKDGSVFSGIFFTASVDNGFGIVLKNARITKKGTSKSNVASGTVVDTLVILSSNIVQIVAEGVSLPSNVRTCNNEVGSATETLPSEPRLCAANVSTQGRGYNHKRQAGAKILKPSVQIPDIHQEDNIDIQSSSSSLDSISERVKPIEEDNLMPEPFSNGFHDASERPSSTDNSSSQSTTFDDTSELCRGRMASSTASVPIQAVKKAKEFKLNPEAKIFSPSYTKRLSPSPVAVPDVGNIAYIPSNTPMLPVPEAIYPGVGNNAYVPQAPPPSKFVPYGNLTAGHAVSGFQFPQHMIGPTVNRAQPQRFTSQYHSVQTAPMLVNPSPQVIFHGGDGCKIGAACICPISFSGSGSRNTASLTYALSSSTYCTTCPIPEASRCSSSWPAATAMCLPTVHDWWTATLWHSHPIPGYGAASFSHKSANDICSC